MPSSRDRRINAPRPLHLIGVERRRKKTEATAEFTNGKQLGVQPAPAAMLGAHAENMEAGISSSPPQGGLDGLRDRWITGWAWRPESSRPCHVQVISSGDIVAEAVANAYRRDLLQAGKAMGHCGIRARLRVELPLGGNTLVLVEAESGLTIGQEIQVVVVGLPSYLKDPPITASDLIGPRETWTDEDVLAHLPAFRLHQECEAMGLSQFIDAVFRYVLGRWPDEPAMESYAKSLGSGAITPDTFFAEVLASEERNRMTTPLPSPLDADFPFGRVLARKTPSSG